MELRTLLEVKDWKGKKVFLRVDLNVPLDAKGKIADESRIVSILPTVRFLISRNASLVLATHLGRPDGKRITELQVALLGARLKRYVKSEIFSLKDSIGALVENAKKALQPKQILLLENLRFYKEEEENSKVFAKSLANGMDLYVNDAFSNSHRKHASMCAITAFLPSYAGLLLEKEIQALSPLMEHPVSPSVAIVGGSKIESKLPLLKILLLKYDRILLGGGVANTILLGRGYHIGRSLVDSDFLPKVRSVTRSEKVVTPVDAVTSTDIKRKAKNYIMDVEKIGDDFFVLDIGPKTLQIYEKYIVSARTILWSGPMGMYEVPFFASGTKGVVKAVNKSNAFSVAGGGDTIAAIDMLGKRGAFSHISTGGSAMLEFLSGKQLPSLKPLLKPSYRHHTMKAD